MTVLFFALDEGVYMPIVSDFIGTDGREKRVSMPLTKARDLQKMLKTLAIQTDRMPVVGVIRIGCIKQ